MVVVKRSEFFASSSWLWHASYHSSVFSYKSQSKRTYADRMIPLEVMMMAATAMITMTTVTMMESNAWFVHKKLVNVSLVDALEAEIKMLQLRPIASSPLD